MEQLCPACGTQTGPTFEISMGASQKSKSRTISDPTILLLGVYTPGILSQHTTEKQSHP